MIDQFGRTISYDGSSGEDVYSVTGLTIAWPQGTDPAVVISAFNAQAPSGWTPPPPVPETISDRQFFQQAAIAGLITQAEALAAVQTGTVPAVLMNVINALPDAMQQFAAEMMLAGATQFNRHHPLTEAVGAALSWTPEQIDQFFIAAAAL